MQKRDTKYGTDRVVPLTPAALEVLRRQPRRAESDFGFTKTNVTTAKNYAHLDTKALHRGVTKCDTYAEAREAEIIELFK